MSTQLEEPRTYGAWREPRSAGLYGLSKMATFALLAGLVLVLLVTMAGGPLRGLAVAAVVGAIMFALMRRDAHGRNLIVRTATRFSWSRARRAGAQLYRSGPLGQSLWGTHQLPGIAAQLRLSEHEDGYGRPFALLRCPSTATYSVVIASLPDGESLVDQGSRDLWVARWGQWLADLGAEPGIVGASVTVETSPGDGARLRARLQQRRDPKAPAHSLRVLDELQTRVGNAAPEVRGYTTLVWSSKSQATGKRRSPDEMAHDIASILPQLTASLRNTGAGATHLVSADELCELVRVAYDPAVAPELARARAEGVPFELPWFEVGPVAADPSWDEYRHDSGYSVSYVMSAPPRSNVREDVLRPLLAPNHAFARKRVTLIYAPLDPARTAALVEADLRAAEFRLSASRTPSARDQLSERQARMAADEEASGAALVDFGCIITMTVGSADELDQAKATIRSLSQRSKLTIRPAYGAQASTFAAGLPLGLILRRHSRLSDELRGTA